jgi:hypothetical protein
MFGSFLQSRFYKHIIPCGIFKTPQGVALFYSFSINSENSIPACLITDLKRPGAGSL